MGHGGWRSCWRRCKLRVVFVSSFAQWVVDNRAGHSFMIRWNAEASRKYTINGKELAMHVESEN